MKIQNRQLVAESIRNILAELEQAELEVDDLQVNSWTGVDLVPNVGSGGHVRLVDDDGQVALFVFQATTSGAIGALQSKATFDGMPAGVIARLVACYLA